MRDITAIAAFKDNYIWCLRQAKLALVVDPGDAAVVQQYLQQHQLQLAVILITHHHPDHTWRHTGTKTTPAGCCSLCTGFQNKNKIPYADHWLKDNDQSGAANFNLTFKVMQLPGHTWVISPTIQRPFCLW